MGRRGRGKSPPTAAAARTDRAVLYARTHATTRGSRLPPPSADRVEYSGSSVQSTRQNGYSLLYDAHSVLSVPFLFAVLFHVVFYVYLSLLRNSRFRVVRLALRQPETNRKSPQSPEHTGSSGINTYKRRSGRDRNYFSPPVLQGWDKPTRFMNEK